MKLSQIASINLTSTDNGLYRFHTEFKANARHALRDGGLTVIIGSNKARDVLAALDVKGKPADGRVAIATFCEAHGIDYSVVHNDSFVEDASPAPSGSVLINPSNVVKRRMSNAA